VSAVFDAVADAVLEAEMASDAVPALDAVLGSAGSEMMPSAQAKGALLSGRIESTR